jgi:DNA-directed RNA polymerase specialized sigma24 family protein
MTNALEPQLLLRFYQGFTAEKIAERSSTQIAMVRSHIQRTQVLLREGLDAR